MPGYVAKCWGPALNMFLNNNPVTAALFAQSAFIVFLAFPRTTIGSQKSLGSPLARVEGVLGQCLLSLSRKWSPTALKIALPLGILVCFVHATWYASMPRTSVDTNAVLWNSDTITTPLIAAVLTRQAPPAMALLGGVVGLAGVCLSVSDGATGNTMLGCALVLTSSIAYAINAVIIEMVNAGDPEGLEVIPLLILEGMVTTAMLVLFVCGSAMFATEFLAAWFANLPPLEWLLLLGVSAMLLNVGWLWCTELAGATWTAMAACLSIPLAMALDFFLLNLIPDLMAILGAGLVLLGFALVSYAPEVADPVQSGRKPACERKVLDANRCPLLLPGNEEKVREQVKFIVV